MSMRIRLSLWDICKYSTPFQYNGGRPVILVASKNRHIWESLHRMAAAGYGRLKVTPTCLTWRVTKIRHVRELRKLMPARQFCKDSFAASRWYEAVDTYLTLVEQRDGVRRPSMTGRTIIPSRPGMTKRQQQYEYDRTLCLEEPPNPWKGGGEL